MKIFHVEHADRRQDLNTRVPGLERDTCKEKESKPLYIKEKRRKDQKEKSGKDA